MMTEVSNSRLNANRGYVTKAKSFDSAEIQNKRMKFSPPSPLDLKKTNFNEFEGVNSNLCEGYLYIQSKSLWMFPNHLWKKRYFRLRNDVLYFTKNKGDLIFEDTTPAIEIEADTGIYPEENVKGKAKYFIRICKGKQNFILCSEDEEDRNMWLACLLTVITQKYVVNFKAGFYKSVRLNYKPKPKTHQRHSSFSPKRITDEDQFSIVDDKAPIVMGRAESLFNISPTSAKEFPFSHERNSFVAMQ